MKNYLITISYKGKNFCGWQVQPNGRSVQAELVDAIKNLTGEDVKVLGSGRTDAGVHAFAQMANFLTNSNIPTKKFPLALVPFLPDDISVLDCKEVPLEFNAQFSAKRKTYQYNCYVSNVRDCTKDEDATQLKYMPDIELMKKGASLLIGKHNFKAFCSANTSVTNYERRIYSIVIENKGNSIVFSVSGNGFLYNMVRIIVGSLIDLGNNKISINDLSHSLVDGNRQRLGKTMPAKGLHLKKVVYNKKDISINANKE